MLWAIGLIGAFYLFTLVLGFGAAALLDQDVVREGGRHRAATWPRRCWPRPSAVAPGSTGGAVLLALIAAVAFATILAVVAGLTLTSSVVGGARHLQLGAQGGRGREEEEIQVSRIAACAIGADRDRAGHPGAEPQHRVPRGPGLRGRGVGEPAGDHLQHVLARLQHPRRALEHLRRPDLLRRPGDLLPVVSGKGLDPLTARTCRCCRPASRSCSRSRTPASCRSRSASCSATSARSPAKEPSAEDRYTELEVRALTGAGAEQARRTH